MEIFRCQKRKRKTKYKEENKNKTFTLLVTRNNQVNIWYHLSDCLSLSDFYPVNSFGSCFFSFTSILWAHFYVKCTLESWFSKPVSVYIIIYLIIYWTFWLFLKFCYRHNALMNGCLSILAVSFLNHFLESPRLQGGDL